MSLLPLYSSGGFGSTATDSLVIALDLDRGPFGKTTERVAAAFRRLTGLLAPSDREQPLPALEFHDYAKTCYEQIRADGSNEELLSFLAYVSTFYHEVRHAHDLMGTYYGQELLHFGVNCAQNVATLVVALEKWQAGVPGRSVPLPLRATDQSVRDVDLVRLFTYYESMSEQFASFDKPPSGSPAELTVTHLLEASAVNVQLGFINDVFGEDATYRLVDLIQDASKASLYLQVRDELESEFARRGRTGTGWGRIINCLLWCSLNRPSFPGKPYSEAPNTVVFYEAAAEEVAAEVDQPDLAQARRVIDQFCRGWGLTTPQEAVEKRKNHLADRVQKLGQALEEQGWQDRQFLEIYRGHVNAYSHLASSIFEDPEKYFSPERYVVEVVLRRLPEVFVLLKWRGETRRFVFGSPAMLPPEQWEVALRMAASWRIILNGRGSVKPPFLEELGWENLTQNSQEPIRFRDRLFESA